MSQVTSEKNHKNWVGQLNKIKKKKSDVAGIIKREGERKPPT